MKEGYNETCTGCGRPILPVTAKITGGVCRVCEGKRRAEANRAHREEARRAGLRPESDPTMTRVHSFLLVDHSECPPAHHARLINALNAVRIHDDLILYLADSLDWIPTLNPATGKNARGLNFCGPTAILDDGASIAQRIFSAWADLFAAGPPELMLTGNWTHVEGEPMESGRYESFTFPRDKTVSALRAVADYAGRVSRSSGKLYVLHLGI